MKKKVFSTLLLLLFCSFLLCPDTANAAEMTPVTFNTPFTDMLEDTENDIYYSFTVDQTGYFYLDFSVVDFTQDTGSGWVISLHDGKNGTEIYDDSVTSSTTFPTFNFKEGTKLYIKVANSDHHTESSAPVGILYSMELVAVKDTSWEQEGNDSIREATVLTANTDCNGNLYYVDDVDYYEYTVTEKGYFNLDFSVADITADTGSGWTVTFYNAKNGSEIYREEITGSTTFPTFNFAKETKLYIKVARSDGYTDESVPASVQYTLNVKSVKDSFWEQELNDTAKTANTLKANTLYTGNLYHCDDVDYYTYKTANSGYFNLLLAPADITADLGSGLGITVYNAANNTELWYFDTEDANSITLPTCYFKKGTSLIFKVARVNGYTDWSVPTFVPYTLKVDFTKTSYAEKESFLTAEETWATRKKNATAAALNKKYVGNLWNNTDNDVYKFNISKAGYLTLKFDPNELADALEDGYTVTLFTSAGEMVYELSGTTALSKKVYLAKGYYYAEVRAKNDYGAPVKMEYTLSTTYKAVTPAQVTTPKVSGTKLTWTKAKEASGYQLQYSLKKDFSGSTSKNTTKLTYTLSGLKADKTYYVRVRAYKKSVTGTKVYGAWSDVITVKK